MSPISHAAHQRLRSTPRAARARLWTIALTVAAGAAACDVAQPSTDAQAPQSARAAALSVRLDEANGQTSLTALAFRAHSSGVDTTDVLGLVDPLAAHAPRAGCELRDFDHAATTLVARGDSIDLEELPGVTVALGEPPVAVASPNATAIPTDLPEAERAISIRPSARLYPEVASVISGVVSAAGPFALTTVPDHLRVRPAEGVPAATLSVPVAARLALVNGAPPRSGLRIDGNTDLSLAFGAGTDPATVELRPFGATAALVCAAPVGGTGELVVPRQQLAELLVATRTPSGASVGAALDIVRRNEEQVTSTAADLSLQVSVEIRTSTLVELRP